MNDDYLINLLPSEYLPKPEFRTFPIFVIILLGLTGAFIAQDYARVNAKIDNLNLDKTTTEALIKSRTPIAMEALDVQARSRMLAAYGITIWNSLHQNPPWVDVYNELEENLPEGMWIQSLKLSGVGEKKWPSFTLVGIVAGKEPEQVLAFYEKLLEPTSKFDKVNITGYTFVKHGGKDAVTFNMKFSLKKTSFYGL